MRRPKIFNLRWPVPFSLPATLPAYLVFQDFESLSGGYVPPPNILAALGFQYSFPVSGSYLNSWRNSSGVGKLRLVISMLPHWCDRAALVFKPHRRLVLFYHLI